MSKLDEALAKGRAEGRKKLGRTQADVLGALIRNGHFACRRSGWYWTSYNATVKYLDKLVEYGYAKRVDEGKSGVIYYPL